MTRRTTLDTLMALLVFAVLLYVAAQQRQDAALPATSEMVRVPAQSGSGSSAVSLVPGAPLRMAVPPSGTPGTNGMRPASSESRAAAVHPARLPDTSTVVRGVASHVGTQFGRRYLALPEHRWGHPGIRVRICGAGGCIVRTSTDAGPDKAMQRAGRVADLNAWDFTTVCGCPASRGTTHVTVEYLAAQYDGPLPATDTEGS